jgi:hypothetical protein
MGLNILSRLQWTFRSLLTLNGILFFAIAEVADVADIEGKLFLDKNIILLCDEEEGQHIFCP